MAFCKRCGKELPESAQFCDACGTAVEVVQGVAPAAAAPVAAGQASRTGAPQAPVKKPRTGLIIAVIAVVAIVLIGGGVAGGLIYHDAKKKPLAAQTTLEQTGMKEATTPQADDVNAYDSVIKAYQDFQASGYKTYTPVLSDTFLARYKDADGTTAGGGIDNIAQAQLVYLLRDINNDGASELFVGIQESGLSDVSYFDVWGAQEGETALLLSPGSNQNQINLLSDGSLEEIGGRMGSYSDWVFMLPAHSTKLTVSYGMRITQQDNTNPDSPYTFEQATGALAADSRASYDFSAAKMITASEYAQVTGRPDPAGKANADLWEWAVDDNRPNNKAVTLSWTPLSGWKFADGTTSTQSTTSSASIHTPTTGTPERQALMDAARAKLAINNQFVVNSLYSNGTWAVGSLTISPASTHESSIFAWHKAGGAWTCADVFGGDYDGPEELRAELKTTGMPDDLIAKQLAYEAMP